MHQDNVQALTDTLNRAEKEGVSLFLEGHPSNPATIAKCCVRESETYMADYILDDAGHLKELRYDRVRNL